MRDIVEIKDVLGTVIEQLGAKGFDRQQKIVAIFTEALADKKCQKHCAVVGLKENILYVRVDAPAYLYQCQLKKNAIISRIQKEFSDFKSISFKIGKAL